MMTKLEWKCSSLQARPAPSIRYCVQAPILGSKRTDQPTHYVVCNNNIFILFLLLCSTKNEKSKKFFVGPDRHRWGMKALPKLLSPYVTDSICRHRFWLLKRPRTFVHSQQYHVGKKPHPYSLGIFTVQSFQQYHYCNHRLFIREHVEVFHAVSCTTLLLCKLEGLP